MKKYLLLIFAILLIGFLLRIYHIEFGLPHSFYADEPEFVEPAIKYTYELRDIIKNNNYYKLIPVSFVYGTFPVYVYTAAIMAFSKLLNILHIGFGKMSLYVYARILTAVFTYLGIGLPVFFLGKKLFKSKVVPVLFLLLFALNWKFIVHAHYVNADIVLTALLSLSFLTLYQYYKENSKENSRDTLYTVLTGVLLGLAVGTKITALITLPLYVYIYFIKKDYKGFIAMSAIIVGVFILTNPFSLILYNDFAYRIFSMFTKEAGLVFDSVDSRPYKYLMAISYISTLGILAVSLYGMIKNIRNKADKHMHYFLAGNLILYLIFFSLQSRKVDRWLLPVLPIVLLYASDGIVSLSKALKKEVFVFTLLGIFGLYLYYPFLLLNQFGRNTPKSQAYIWMKTNSNPLTRKLVYTEEGLDPMNKLEGAKVYKIEVYTSENAQYFFPDDPDYYDYVIISSRPLENYKRHEVRTAYPLYYQKWADFEKYIEDENNFRLVHQVVLPKPNLIPLSDVLIYKNLKPAKPLPAARAEK